MAGDWIAWQKGLSKKVEVLRIAGATGRPRREVACLLMEFWEWADDQTEDGFLPAQNVRNLSACHADTDDAFWREVAAAGWLTIRDDGIEIPNYTNWMGKSAKRRLKESRRKDGNRNDPRSTAQSVRTMSASHADKKRAREEKSRDIRSSPIGELAEREPEAGSAPPNATPTDPKEPTKQRQPNTLDGGDSVLTFPCNGPVRTWALTANRVERYRELYPGLDVLAECRFAHQWILDNPARRKTAVGMPSYLTKWLGRAVNRAPGTAAGQRPAAGRESHEERVRRIMGE